MHSLDRELLKHEADISSVFAILLKKKFDVCKVCQVDYVHLEADLGYT